MKQYIKCNQIYCEDHIKSGFIEWDEQKITAILPESNFPDKFIDAQDKIIIPGIIDVHNHGSRGYGMFLKSEDVEFETHGYLRALTSQGITSVLPTFFGSGDADMITCFATRKQEFDEAQMIGINMEGPYLSRINGIDSMPAMANIDEIKNLVEISGNKILTMGIAPEFPGAYEIIHYLQDQEIDVSIAHTAMNADQCKQAIQEGIHHVTHIGNVMTGIHQRDIGTCGVCLLDDRVFAEMICDGIHLSMDMIQLIMRVKDVSHIMMISDSSCYSGMKNGTYPGVAAEDDRITIDGSGIVKDNHGVMWGSGRTVLNGISNLVKQNNVPLETAVQMACSNPARYYNIYDIKGSITVGKDADFLVLNQNLELEKTYCRGKLVFEKGQEEQFMNLKLLQ